MSSTMLPRPGARRVGPAGLCLLTIAILGVPPVCAQNIDPDSAGHSYGWTENAGWLNMKGNGSSSGVIVSGTPSLSGLSGVAWMENLGWINVGDGVPATPPHYSNASGSDFGVNLDTATGRLSGLAWGENIGWINFDTFAASGQQIAISKSTGEFSGKAWSENIGWISFDGLGAYTAKTDPAVVPVSLSGFALE